MGRARTVEVIFLKNADMPEEDIATIRLQSSMHSTRVCLSLSFLYLALPLCVLLFQYLSIPYIGIFTVTTLFYYRFHLHAMNSFPDIPSFVNDVQVCMMCLLWSLVHIWTFVVHKPLSEYRPNCICVYKRDKPLQKYSPNYSSMALLITSCFI